MSVHNGGRGPGHTSRKTLLGAFSPGGTPGNLAAPVLTWTSGTSTYDPTFNITQIVEADVVEIQIDDNSDFSSLYDSDTNTVDAGEAASGSLTFSGISTLGFGTTYYARARYTRGSDTSDWSNTVSKAMDAADTTPDAFTFTDATNVATSSTQTSNAITVTGISGGGTTAAISITGGTYSVNGGAYTSSSGTVVLNDSVTVRHTASGSASTATNTVLTIGGVSDTFTSTTAAASGLPSSGLILQLDADDTSTLFNTITGTGAVTDGTLVGKWNDKSSNAFHLAAAANDATRPTYTANSGLPYLLSSGSVLMKRASALGLKGNAYTIAIAMRTTGTPGSANLAALGEGRSTVSNNPVYAPLASNGGNTVYPFLRDDSNVAYSPSGNLDVDAFDGNDTVLLLTHDGAGNLVCYEDGDTTGQAKAYTPGTTTVDTFAIFGVQRNSAGLFLPMRMYALAVWNRVLNSTERATVRTYMGAKQGRTL